MREGINVIQVPFWFLPQACMPLMYLLHLQPRENLFIQDSALFGQHSLARLPAVLGCHNCSNVEITFLQVNAIFQHVSYLCNSLVYKCQNATQNIKGSRYFLGLKCLDDKINQLMKL